MRHVSRNPDGIGTVSVPAVTLADAMVAYQLAHWQFALNINNLTDKDYLAYCGAGGDCSFGTRRKGVASVTYRW